MACALPAVAGPAGFVQVRGRDFVTPGGEVLRLRGIGLGNWLLPEGYMWGFKKCASPRQIENLVAELVGDVSAAEFWRQWRETFITQEDFRLIAGAGFNSVRIPINWRLFVSEHAPHRLEGPGWALLDRAIRWCAQERLYVVIDLHGAPGGQTGANIDDSRGRPLLFEDPAAQQLTIALWQEIARRYRDEPWVLGYDLLNEPIADYFDTARLNPMLADFYRRLVPAVRAEDPRHVILLGGAQWNQKFEILGPPTAGQVAYTFHLYWAPPTRESIAPYLDWREKTDLPMWLGESGENTDAWVREFRVLLEQHEIGWCFWTYKRMDTTRSVASYARPDDWDAIVAYSETPRGDDYDAIRAAVPPLETARRALAQLLQNIQASRSTINQGYLDALGLHAP
jgi:hypothetical protein